VHSKNCVSEEYAGMNNFWSLFWKLFGAALLIMVMVGCVWGLITRSLEVMYTIVQQTLVVGMGICGIIGFVVIPIELYFDDRSQRRNHVTK
jgi:hypothetical protein